MSSPVHPLTDESPSGTGGTVALSPMVGRLVVRALGSALDSTDFDAERLLRRGSTKDLLRRYLGLRDEDLTGPPDQAVHYCLARCRQMDLQIGDCADDASKQLGDDLASALRMTGVEQDLLVLAVYANREPDVRRAMDAGRLVDDAGAAQCFGDMLGHSQWSTLEALRRQNPLRRMSAAEVLNASSEAPSAYLRFSPQVMRVLQVDKPSVDSILSLFFQCSAPARLALTDFAHQAADIALVQRFLRKSLETGRTGVNVLIHGEPGTGKTELARALAASLEARLMEVPVVDEDKDPLPPWKRLTSYCAAQDALRQRDSILILFDEIEDVFPDDSDGFRRQSRHRGSRDRHKGWLTRVLEANGRPTIWIGNAVAHIDPAYLRRFDVVVELTAPSLPARQNLVQQLFEGLPVPKERLAQISAQTGLAPAHVERIAGVIRAIEPANDADAVAMLDQLMCQALRTFDIPAVRTAHRNPLGYRSDCLNAKVDLCALAEALRTLPVARICLYGPPGTGKSEWSRQLAERIGRPLHVKRSSDLLSKYIGETEGLIRHAFGHAEKEGAILIIDEADALLRSRDSISHGWEASMINEVLTSMEDFQGIFVASTNMIGALDAASARRFDFKVEFDYLKREQVRTLFSELLTALGLSDDELPESEFTGLEFLTPGDFANVMRQARLLPQFRSPANLLALLRREQDAKPGIGVRRRFGFM